MPQTIDIDLAGHSFRLFAQRCMFWPAQDMLLVADTHLGKEATFRRSGIPVPLGVTEGTLNTVAAVLRQTGARRLCILGHLFHNQSSLSAAVCREFEAFLRTFVDVEMLLIVGNHDLQVGRLPSEWPIKVLEPGLRIDRVALGHHPGIVPDAADLYLCGHLHPGIQVRLGHESIGPLPCFWHAEGCMVLPAIGHFTGTFSVQPKLNDDVWLIADNDIRRHVMARSTPSVR